MRDLDSGEQVVLAGPFQLAPIVMRLPAEAAAQLAGLSNFAGVPVSLLAGALADRGVKTTLINGVRGAEPRFIHGDPLSVAIYKGSGGWPFLLTGRLRERNEILARLREIQPRIVHANWTLEAGRAVADWRGPKVLTVHDAAWEYMRLGWMPQPISTAYGLRWLANTSATIKGYRHIIAVCPYAETYLRLTPRFTGEIRVIPNVVPPLPEEIKPVERFPRTGRVTFGCYGEPGPLKNVHAAINAMKLVNRTLPEAKMLVFGGGWDKFKAELGGDGRVEFRGGLPHREFLRAMAEEVDVWVHPSRIEMHPVTLCEAIQAGCPVIAGRDAGGVAWTLDYGRAGILVDVTRPEELAEAMCILVADRTRSAEMVGYGRRFIGQNFNADRVVDLHLAYYRDICSE